MDTCAGITQPVPNRRGSAEQDDHWLESLDLDRSALAEEAVDPADLDGDEEPTDPLEEDYAPEEDEDFRA